MSEYSLKPFNGKLDESAASKQQPALKPFTGALDGEKKGVMGHLKDTGISALKGAIAVPEIAVGIMDTMSDGAVGKTLENKNGAIGFRPKEAKQVLSDLHTDQYKAQQQEFADAGKDGSWADKVVDKTKVALTNPSLIANTVVESVPSMLAGGVLGRASGIANPVLAGAVGEGAVMAGSQAEQIRQETVDGRLTADQSLAGATTGVLGGLIGFAGGRIAQKLGIGDVDTMLVNGKLGPAEIAGEIASMPAKSLPRRVVEGAISEGFLEELPQSVSEQILQNLALDKPWSDGIEDAAVMGTLAGMAMGGAANILSSHNTGTENPDNPQQLSGVPNLPLPSAPPQLGLSPDSALTGEYIPRENASQRDNQGRTAFVYDQPSMDADNLLSSNYEGDADFNTPSNLDPSNNPLSPSDGNYFEDHSTQQQLPSEHLGINPNDGPMSSAAALAVDSGASQRLNISQNDAKNEGPLSGSVPSEYQSLLASNNENFPVVTNGLDKTSQLNDGDVSQSAITEQNKGIENPETAPPNLSVVMGVQSKVTELETQLANEKSVIKKVRLRKQIAELQKDNPIDQAAHAAATSIQNDLPEPSQAQIEAGNYKKGHIKVHGLDIAVENPRGSERRGTDPDGKDWAHTMSDHYGYIKRTTGADNENIDTYVGNSPESEQVYIVDQIDQKTGGFDEHKVMLGFNSQEDAIQAYSSNFDKGWKVGAVRTMNKDEFKSWLKDGGTKKPAGDTLINAGTKTATQGKTEKVYTPGTNREIEVRHKVVEADSLVTSNDANGAVNPNFPQHLQPRDRSRPTSIAQVHDIASNLNPKLLGENPSTASGAPIVSAEGVVESGNGRTMAILKAYEQGKGDAYRKWLSKQGHDLSGMKNPVLVRERTTLMSDQELLDYTKESNESTTLIMSPTEQAMMDAKAVVDLLSQYRGGDINSVSNRDFVNRFLTELVPTSERGKMLSAGTGLTQDGQRRINAALVAAAYSDMFIVDQVFENTESDIKAIGNALTDVAGFWAKMRDMSINGQIPKDLDITLNLVEAVHLVQKARLSGTKLAELVAQDDIFSGAVDPVTLDFLSVFYRGDKYTRARGRERVVDALNHYAQQAMQQFSGENLFGDKPKNNTQLRGETLDRLDQQETDKQQDIFASSQPDDRNTESTRGAGQRTSTESADTKTHARKETEVKSKSSKSAAEKPKEIIQDFGEKIGGARKDTAVKTGKKSVADKAKDDRPTWAKRFEISEIAASSNPAEVGKWTISDTKNKDWMGNNRRLTNQIFNTQKEAESFLPVAAVAMKHRVTTDTKDGKKSYIIVRTVSDRKHVQVVQQLFDTRDEANEYLVRHAQEILETNTTFGELDLPRPENTQRTGVARREGDAKDSDFSRVFGFRGVEFGNWNNQVERQELLNDAFDGLMDLAEVLNIPPEALSLNGELALAFGARGQGLSSAKAHYESNRVVINLTKMNGAGSLAHEWWHAFDHYLSRQDGSASSAWIQHEDGSRSLNVKANPADRFASHGFKVVKSGVREDVRNNFEKLMVTLFRRSQAYIEDSKTADEFVARSRDEVQDKLNSIRENLAKQLDPKYYKRFNKPASTDQLAEFDTAAELIITGQLLETEARKNPKSRSTFGGYRHTNDALDKINEIFKAVRGRSGFNADFKGVLDYLRGSMSRYMGRLKLLADAQQSTTKHKSVPTEFAMNAKELDQGRGSDYWTTPHEMSARAFQGYVEDKISAKNARSPFLNYGPENVGIITPYGVKRPFPYGEERVAINQAFDDLISGLKTEQTDSGKRLYSRKSNNKKASVTVNGVRQILIDRFGEDTIAVLERQGKLEIIQDYQVEGVEGFYYNGKAVLVASNLTAESTVPTFLHELGGHAGFQNMMNQKQYNELMNQFNKLVEQGNPVALAAKMLAEREQGSERQQLEYLPYLLTLSSTLQQRNVIQRNALQKLINNIVSYVKAWVFDNFGINLNLNPDDILALSERMIGQIKHQSSLDLIRQKYHGTSQWMTAPNGAKTHLSEQQWLQVRTPEFKKWFGDWEHDAANASQVLDENGEPKVVYHGTATEFNEFTQGHGLLGDGIYLTDSFDTADMYANIRGNNGFVLPLFVNIRNAFKTTGNVSRDKVVEATKSGKYQGVVHQFENHEYIVALEPNQVKIAEGNTGTFNSESSDIRFSRSAKDVIDNLSKTLSNISISSVKDKTGYKFTDWLGIGLSALGRRQLTEIYCKLLPQLNIYNDLAAQMDADKNDAGAEADGIVREWANLKDENQLAELMHDATLAKIDPTKPYVKGDSVSRYKQLRDDYNSLSPEAQSMYLKARDAYKKHYAKVHQAIKERILRSELSSQKKADLLKQMDDNFFGYVKGVYFPLARFGKYVVVMRNQNGEVESVSRAETMGEAQRLRSELMQKYPHYKTDRVMLDKAFNASRDAVGRGFMTSLFAEVDNLGLSTAEQAEFEDTLSQLYLSSMPDLSWAKHGIHRKGTAGFSQDARRAFAQNMFHGAGYLAKLRYGDQLAQQLDDMQKYTSEQSKLKESFDQPTAQRVIDEMNNRHDNLMNPKSHPLSSALTSFGFIYYLGLSPAAAMVNLSQTALVAYPIMGAKWGFDKAANELLKASNDFRKGVEFHKVKWEGSKTDLYKSMSADISNFLNNDEKQAYDEAVSRGVIDVTQAHDLAGIAQGEDSGIMWKTRPIMRAASVLFHNAERFNREVTFIASYRLARQAGVNHESAFDQAVDATYRGHFDYSSGNRPRIMQGNVAKVLLLFKQFGQNMVYTLARQTYQSIKGETEAERKEARKSLGAILAMHATFAGTLGLPMVGMLLSVASWMGGDDDEPWDAEVALRNYLAEAFGPTISNLLMKGAPRALTPIDLSGRVGINNMLLPDVQEGLEGKRWAESAMAGALGPVAGIGTNLVKGGQDITEGQTLRGIETMLPVFLKNFAKTYRYADEGVQDKTGVSIMDEVSSMDLLVQGMGFSPSDVRTANEGKTAIYQLNRKLNERRSRLMTLWSRAKMMDDQQEMGEIWEEIQGFNDKNPSRRITRINLNQSYRNRQRRIDRAEDGIYLSRNRQDAREAGYFAFGE